MTPLKILSSLSALLICIAEWQLVRWKIKKKMEHILFSVKLDVLLV